MKNLCCKWKYCLTGKRNQKTVVGTLEMFAMFGPSLGWCNNCAHHLKKPMKMIKTQTSRNFLSKISWFSKYLPDVQTLGRGIAILVCNDLQTYTKGTPKGCKR